MQTPWSEALWPDRSEGVFWYTERNLTIKTRQQQQLVFFWVRSIISAVVLGKERSYCKVLQWPMTTPDAMLMQVSEWDQFTNHIVIYSVENITSSSYVKEMSLTMTYDYWLETNLTIHSSIFRSLQCICHCTFIKSGVCSLQHAMSASLSNQYIII